MPACSHDAPRERVLQRHARRARVAPDEDAALAAGPKRRRVPEPFDELLGQELADDPANAVGSEVPPSHRRASLQRAADARSLSRPSSAKTSSTCTGRDGATRRRGRDLAGATAALGQQRPEALKAELSALGKLGRLARLVQPGLLALDL